MIATSMKPRPTLDDRRRFAIKLEVIYMTKLICLSALAALLLLGQNQNPPYVVPEGVKVVPDVVYAAIGPRQMHLDLYLPKNGAGSFPAVVYIHGGGWSGGNRAAFRRQAAYMATKGYAGACIEYRLSGEASYPAALYDSKAAVRWVRGNAAQYHIDPNRIAAAGGSAGGHLVALLGTTADKPAYEGDEGVTGVSSRVAAVAAFNPAVDLVDFGKRVPADAEKSVTKFLAASYQEKPQLWKEASPTYQVTARSAPFLFLHGDADTTVPYQQSVQMMEKLKTAGVSAELFTAPGAKHGFFNAPPWYEPTLKRMEEFFNSILRPKT
jgi:acetyl esterase/lipase